ncbi:cytochrome c oxidase subunit II [Brevibacterium sp.]|uniref:aa3-type cytochrome oxidase subunit II n=1 Tax=Brevibacterium sp. TaxID=1701 RepID=UPI002811FD83|nr:cytochrome c oxidase subunit II [Brevibacterium sp.]
MDSPNQPGPKRSWAKRLGILGAVTIPALLSGCTKEQIATGFFPVESKGATNHTEAYTSLWNGAWIASLVLGLIVWGLILWAMIAYRRRKNDRGLPVQLRYSMPIEILFTVTPIIVVLGFFFQSVQVMDKTTDDRTPGEQVIEVAGKQWAWDFNYVTENVHLAGTQVALDGTEAPEKTAPTLYLPVDTDLEIRLRSRDVIHSFWIPAFLEKRDMIPGHPQSIHLRAEKEGEYVGKCAELCGEYHSEMLFNVKVVSQQEFEQYTKSLADQGNTGVLGPEYDRNWYPKEGAQQ